MTAMRVDASPGGCLRQPDRHGMILSTWDGYLQTKPQEVRDLFGATPRFEDYREFLPLQAADLWAWWIRKWHEDGCPTEAGTNMVMRGLLPPKKRRYYAILSFEEEQIVDCLKTILASKYPGITVCDKDASI